jgi:hypothetical protein
MSPLAITLFLATTAPERVAVEKPVWVDAEFSICSIAEFVALC